MQINVMRVREYQLNQPQGVTRSRFLSNGELSRAQLLEDLVANPSRGYELPIRGDDLVVVHWNVVTVAPDSRQDFGALNTRRHVPVGTKHDISHFLLKNRRFMPVGFPNDYICAQHDPVVFVKSPQVEFRNVHDDWRLWEFDRYPPPP